MVCSQDGLPDGATVDSEGCLWVAVYGSGEVRRYSPDGELLRTIPVSLLLFFPFLVSLRTSVQSCSQYGMNWLLCFILYRCRPRWECPGSSRPPPTSPMFCIFPRSEKDGRRNFKKNFSDTFSLQSHTEVEIVVPSKKWSSRRCRSLTGARRYEHHLRNARRAGSEHPLHFISKVSLLTRRDDAMEAFQWQKSL